MESLYLLIPLSAALVLAILAVFAWAVHGGQFEDLEAEGERILADEVQEIDAGQASREGEHQESAPESLVTK